MYKKYEEECKNAEMTLIKKMTRQQKFMLLERRQKKLHDVPVRKNKERDLMRKNKERALMKKHEKHSKAYLKRMK